MNALKIKIERIYKIKEYCNEKIKFKRRSH